MCSWVLAKIDGGSDRRIYVAEPGSKWSYTASKAKARKFASREEAEADACGNEIAVRYDR